MGANAHPCAVVFLGNRRRACQDVGTEVEHAHLIAPMHTHALEHNDCR
jgi:hypothetical protein